MFEEHSDYIRDFCHLEINPTHVQKLKRVIRNYLHLHAANYLTVQCASFNVTNCSISDGMVEYFVQGYAKDIPFRGYVDCDFATSEYTVDAFEIFVGDDWKNV